MGIGDEIMVTGRVRRMAEGKPEGWKVAIRDQRKAAWHRWHPVWENNPYIAQPGQAHDAILDDCGDHRPYIISKSYMRYVWREYRPPPGDLYLTPEEWTFAAEGAGAVVVNPAIKSRAPPNKQWPLERWNQLLASAPDIDWVQIGDGSEVRLPGARFVHTAYARQAFGVILGCEALVCHEGALHHAAAAMGIPAVVIRGGYISPDVTGYEGQRDLWVPSPDHPLGCGMRLACPHCNAAMDSITPAMVLAQLEHLL